MALRSINNIVQTFGDPNATTHFDGHKGFYVAPPEPPARLGEASDNAASSAQAIMDDWGGDGNGYYWIQTTGMANPAQLWCDMGHSIAGRGYMRFWWYGTWYTGDGYTEQQSDFEQQAQFGIADISNIDKNAKHGRGRVPAGFNWTSLLVRGRHPGQSNTGNNHSDFPPLKQDDGSSNIPIDLSHGVENDDVPEKKMSLIKDNTFNSNKPTAHI